MTDSGFSGIPPAPPGPAAETGAAPARGDVLRVVETGAQLRHVTRAQRTVAEVIAENRDGTLRLVTREGTITVPKPPQRPDIAVGAKIEIEIPPGHPPRQITIRTPPPADPAPIAQTPDTRTPAVKDNAPPIVTTPARPPVAIPDQPPPAPVTTTPAPLPPEQIVRLLPLAPEQAADMIKPPVTIPVELPPLPPPVPAIAPDQAARPDTLIKTLLTLPIATAQETAQHIAQTVLPTLPAAAWTTPAPLPAHLPAPVQKAAAPLITLLHQPAAPDSLKPASPLPAPLAGPQNTMPSPLLQWLAPAVTPSPAPLLTLTPLRLPPATQAFVMAMPENHIQTARPILPPPGAAPPAATPATGMIAPRMDAQIVQIMPPPVTFIPPGAPSSPAPAITPPAPFFGPPADLAGQPGALQGVVRGVTPQNLPILGIMFPALDAAQDFIMQYPASNLPPGAPVTVMPQPGTLMPVAGPLPALTPLPELFAPGLWPAFDEAFQALQQAAPQAAQVMAHSLLPHPAAAPARLPAVAMMFIAAISGGDILNWLGEKTADTLRRIGKADTIARIGRDGAALSRLAAAETAPQEWRSLPLPLVWDNHVHKIFLHYRHDRDRREGENDDAPNGTRFILDLKPPRMGAVQLDALHRAAEGKSRLDLIVRTAQHLSPAMQQAMRRLYVHALEQSALSGELSFQNKSWVKPEAPTTPHPSA